MAGILGKAGGGKNRKDFPKHFASSKPTPKGPMAEMAETPAEMVETVEVAEMAETPAEMVETVEVAEMAETPAEMVETVEVAEMAEMAETPAEMVETVEVAEMAEMAETPAEMVETVEVAEMAATPAEMVETVEVAEMAESPAEMADVESPPVKRVAWDDGQDAPEPKLSRTFSRSVSRASSSANLAAKKGVKFSWSFVREIVFWEVLFRQIPMAYIVTVPAFLCMFVVTRLIQPSRQFEAEIPPGNTTLSLYVSWIPFGRDEIHQTAYGHFEWYVIYEVVGKALQLAMATWVLARLMLGREKFWQQSWRWEALGFAFFVGVMAAVNVCGAVVGHSQISTECVPVPYPFIAPASSFPCFVIFSLKMKRILGDHQFATLAVAILSQVFVLSTEYIVFVRNASMWPDSDLVIFIYKYTLQPFLWTFVIFPVAPRYSLFLGEGMAFWLFGCFFLPQTYILKFYVKGIWRSSRCGTPCAPWTSPWIRNRRSSAFSASCPMRRAGACCLPSRVVAPSRLQQSWINWSPRDWPFWCHRLTFLTW